MKKWHFILLFFCFSFLPLLTSLKSVGESETPSGYSKKRIMDSADIFESEDEIQLEAHYQSIAEKNMVELCVLIEKDLNGTSPKSFLEHYFKQNKCGYGATNDCVLMVISMDPNNRVLHIQGYGEAKFRVDDNRCDKIYQTIKSDMSSGNYKDALEEFADQIDFYWNMDSAGTSPHTQEDKEQFGENRNSSKKSNPVTVFLIRLAISIGAGGLFVFILFYHSSGKITVNSNTYLQHNQSRILAKQDRYLRTTITKHPKPKESSSDSDSSRGGQTANDSSHSSGGGSF